MKEYQLHEIRVNYKNVQYFFREEKPDDDGNPHCTIFIIDGDNFVYEIKQQCYECEIEEIVMAFCECDL